MNFDIPANLDEARIAINAADKRLAVYLRDSFTLSAEPHEIPADFTLTDDEQDELDKGIAPQELVFTVLKYVDLTDLHPQQRGALCGMISVLVERYRAGLGVAQHKEKHPEQFANEHGRYSSYDKVRHDAVIAKGGDLIPSNPEAGKAIWKSLADYFVVMQDDYLNKGRGPMAEFFYWQQSGIKPAIKPNPSGTAADTVALTM